MDAGHDFDERPDPPARRDLAAVLEHHPVDDLQERRLARPVHADEPDRFPRLSSEVDVLQHPPPRVLWRLATKSAPHAIDKICRAALTHSVGAESLPHLVYDDGAFRQHLRIRSPSV